MSGRLGNKAFSNIKLHKNEDRLIMIPLNGTFAPLIQKDPVTGNYFFNEEFVDGNTFNGTSPSIVIDVNNLTINNQGTVNITVTIGGIDFVQIVENDGVKCFVGTQLCTNTTPFDNGLEFKFTFTNPSPQRVKTGTEPLKRSDVDLSQIRVELKYKKYEADENGEYILNEDGSNKLSDTVSSTTGLGKSIVIDNTAPEILLIGDSEVTVERGTSYTDLGATATDNNDEIVNVSTSGSVNSNIVGSYTVTYSATDTADNTATETRTVNVVDNILPFLELSGDPVDFILKDETYNDEGVNNIDTATLTINPSTVNTSSTGSKTITYTATEQSLPNGTNHSSFVTREVNVFEKSPPQNATLSKSTANENDTIKLSWDKPHVSKVFDAVVDGYLLEIDEITVKEVTAVDGKYVIDEVSQKSIVLEKGRVYTFKYPEDNPLKFSTNDGSYEDKKDDEYNTNVSVNEADSEVTIRIPDENITLFYYCENHEEMGGQISIVDRTTQPTEVIQINPKHNNKVLPNFPEISAGYSIELYTLYSDGPDERGDGKGYLGTDTNMYSESAVALLNIKITVTVSLGAISLAVAPQRVMNSVTTERTVNVYANLNKEYGNVSGIEGSETWSTGTILNSIDFNITCAASNIVNVTKTYNGIDAIAFGAVTDETDVSFVKCSGLDVGTGSLDNVKICSITVKDIGTLAVNNVIFANGNELWDTKDDPNVSITDFEISGQVDLN